jgi:hypothetical protein
MTTWYVTTGISLWETSRCWKLEGVDSQVLQQADTLSESKLLAKEDGPALIELWKGRREEIQRTLSAASVSDKQPRAKELVRDHFRQECWCQNGLKALPAELATLWALFHGQIVQEGDTVTFIQGQSNADVAYMLEAMLGAALNGLPRVRTAIVGPYALDPTESDAFNAGVRDMWDEVKDTNPKAFVLTGGYKAVLIAIARKAPHGTLLFYSHESDPSQLIPLTAQERDIKAGSPLRPSS